MQMASRARPVRPEERSPGLWLSKKRERAPSEKISLRASSTSTSPRAPVRRRVAGVPDDPAVVGDHWSVRRFLSRDRCTAEDPQVEASGSFGAARIFARPQSITRTSPKEPAVALAGLRSRCSTPRAWAKATASQMRREVRERSGAGVADLDVFIELLHFDEASWC